MKLKTINGITHIHSKDNPLHPEKTVTFEEEMTIGEKDEKGEMQLYKPSQFTVDSADNIYISDRADQAIKIFDRNGNYQKTIGRKGEGPGEFLRISRMAFLPDGRLLVMDWRAKRTSLFNKDGEFMQSYKWQASHFDVYLTSESSYTINEFLFGVKPRLFIIIHDFSGKKLVSFGEFTPFTMKVLRLRDTTFSISFPYEPQSIFAGDQERQWLYHCLNDKYLIEVYNRNGKLFRKMDRPYEPVPFMRKDAEEYWLSFGENPDSVSVQMAKEVELPKIKTITEQLLVDEQGNLWVKTFEEKIQGDRRFIAYDIFNKEGFYYARVWSSVSPGLFKGRKMYSMVEDKDTGICTLKCYRVIWKDKE